MSSNSSIEVHEIIELAGGLQVDSDEAWRKLSRSQFPGAPARGFCELIQNGLDSYSSETPWEDRWLRIETSARTIALVDFGAGMGLERLRLLITLGGTDKSGDASKIGQWGIGFVAIFNALLKTKRVEVTTKCDEHYVQVVFDVQDPDKKPTLSVHVLHEVSSTFGTRVVVTFDSDDSVSQCLEYAQRTLTYFPCRATINGREYQTVWGRARRSKDAHFFTGGSCHGFLEDAHDSLVVVLCKYEHIGTWSLTSLVAGSSDPSRALQAFYLKDVPYVRGVRITINSNSLSVTISRDGFTLNSAYSEMVTAISDALAEHLYEQLRNHSDMDTIRLNQYVLRDPLARYVRGDSEPVGKTRTAMNQLIELLANAKVYRLSGRRGSVSLCDIQDMRTERLPLFYAPKQINLRWLGGQFERDFVVLPTPCRAASICDFYNALFSRVFDDVVNLDEIEQDAAKMADLATRGIIDKDALRPKCDFRGLRELTSAERVFLKEIDEVLAHRGVREAITGQLHMPVATITTGLIDVDEEGFTIATGIFDHRGNPLADEEQAAEDLVEFSNVPTDASDIASPTLGSHIRLGLRRDHPFIDRLIGTDDPHRPYFALAFLANELALCQKRLVPYSRFYHWVKETMAAAMRQALLLQLTADEEAASA